MSQILVDTLTITVAGLLIVFGVLIFLSYCFAAMKFLPGVNTKDKKKATEVSPPLATGSEGDAIAPSPEGEGAPDKEELAVVIAAAVAAFMSAEHVVTSIRRVEDTAAWSRTGRHDLMVTH